MIPRAIHSDWDRVVDALDATNCRTASFMWIPLDDPIPDGWRLAETAPTHHDRYSKLIEKID